MPAMHSPVDGARPAVPRARGRAGGGTCLLALLVLAGCANAGGTTDVSPSPATGDARTDHDLLLVSPAAAAGERVRRVANTGTERAVVDVVASGGGRIEAAESQDGDGAFRFPRFTDAASAPAAMLRVRPGGTDWMSPGLGSFAFGVDVRLDEVSSGSVADNGDNVLQRGLFGDGAQFKLQLDKRVPSCLVTGDEGSVMVSGSTELSADDWYRLRCERTNETVALDVTRLADGSNDGARESGSIGRVEFLPGVPLSVGGKVTETGRPAAATDQFNGLLSDVYLTVHR